MIRVLGIDDEPDSLQLTKIFLQRSKNIDFEGVSSAKEALGKISKEKFDVIVSDYQMPGMSGLDLLYALRSQQNLTPFILFTGHGKEEVAIGALNIGADYYLKKEGDPIKMYSELTEAITNLYKQRIVECPDKVDT